MWIHFFSICQKKAIASRKIVIRNSTKNSKLAYLCPYVGCLFIVRSEEQNNVSYKFYFLFLYHTISYFIIIFSSFIVQSMFILLFMFLLFINIWQLLSFKFSNAYENLNFIFFVYYSYISYHTWKQEKKRLTWEAVKNSIQFVRETVQKELIWKMK